MPKKRRKANTIAQPSGKPCQAPDCKEEGAYKAPASRNKPGEYTWYCLDHVREYNQRWDFFAGMNRAAIEAFMRDALTGERPTWGRDSQIARQYDRLHEAIEAFLHDGPKVSRKQPVLPPKLREALAALDMDYPYTGEALKTRYRILVKRFHPDANKSNPNAEERFKEIAVAYLLLAQHLKTL